MEGVGRSMQEEAGAAELVRQHTWVEFPVWRGDRLERDNR